VPQAFSAQLPDRQRRILARLIEKQKAHNPNAAPTKPVLFVDEQHR
jgi:hypothetical protein